MTTQKYSINNRYYSTFASLESELNFQPNVNYLFDLSYLGLLDVSGDKAQEFLQGQVSCDVFKVTNNQMQQGALCNLKGRVLSLFDVINWQGIKLVLPNDMIESTQKSLAKTAAFSHVKLRPLTGVRCFGIFAGNSDNLPSLPENQYVAHSTEDYCIYALNKNSYLCIVREGYSEQFIQTFKTSHAIRGSLAWHKLQLENFNVEIYPESRGEFLPHRLNLHNTGYINFEKGCYRGQEIIARTHYRAKLKHQLRTFSALARDEIQSGKKLLSLKSGSEVGEIIDYCLITSEEVLVVASVKIDAPNQYLLEGSNLPLN